MYMTASEAAAALGISVQTLRNWDESGYLKANRTAGGHRRYDSEDLKSFMEGDKAAYDVYSTYEGQHLEHVEKLLEQEAEKDPRAKACGGFTKTQIGLLLKNQDTAYDLETKELNKDLDFYYQLAASFSTPYLFDTRVMPNCNTLITYRRIRSPRNILVCESEDVCACTYKEEYGWSENLKDSFKKIVNEIDKNSVEDVMNNARHLTTCSAELIDATILSTIQQIDEITNLKEPKIVVLPPEIAGQRNGVIKLTDTLKKIASDFTEHSYTTFISRLVPENKILVGTKSKDKFGGYAFCPYMLMIHYKDKSAAMMRIGKKLLREGSQHYGVITVV